MRRSIALPLALVALLLLTPGASQHPDDQARKKPAKRTVVLYYFHRTMRCSECRMIESTTQNALKSTFARELRNGRLRWLPTNLDEGDNQKLEDRYGLEVQSLVLSEVVNGKETRWKHLDKTWDIYHDPAALMKYVVAETRAFLGR